MHVIFVKRFEYIPALDSAFGTFFNGSWNGLVGMLYRGVSKKKIIILYYCIIYT